MTEVLFYHLQDMTLENVLPPLLEKSLERGWRVVVQSTSRSAPTRSTRICGPIATIRSCRTPPGAPAMRRISRSCWRSRRAIRTAPMSGSWSTMPRCRRMPTAYERLVLVFNGDDGDALAAARGAWTDCKARGFEVTYWQADERGRWQRRRIAIIWHD